MPQAFIRPALVAALLALCWPAWMLGGTVQDWLELGVLDPVGRVCLVFLVLTGAEAALPRLLPLLPGQPNDSPQ